MLYKLLLFNLSVLFSINLLFPQESMWLDPIQGLADDEGFDVHVDNNGDIITCGYFKSSTLHAGDQSLQRESGCDAYVIKYDMLGNTIWMDNPGGPSWQEAQAVTTDQDNNIYVTGRFTDSFEFAGVVIESYGGKDAFLIKYDGEGNEIWCIGMHSNAMARGWKLVTDPEGNIIIGGRFEHTLYAEDFTLNSHGSRDLFIIKLTPEGELIWAKSFGGYGLDFLMNLNTDKSGNIYFTGGAHSKYINFGDFQFANHSLQRLAFIVQLDPDGNVTWAEGHDDGYDQEYFGVAVDSDLNIFAVGYYKSVFYFSPYTISGSSGHFDIFFCKYNADHEHQWIRKIGTEYYGRSEDVILDKDENPVITAIHEGDLTVQGNKIINNGGMDFTLMKWDSDANLIWTLHGGNEGDDRLFGIGNGPNDNIYFTGYFHSSELEVGDHNIQNMGNRDTYLAALGTPCPPPDPAFTCSINDFTVQFNAPGEADSYSWDFGDGNTSAEQNPLHTYDSIGTYDVCLSVQNICGTAQDCQEVEICVDPVADFMWAASDLTVAFYQFSTLADQYQWDFGDGTHSYEPEPVHEYSDEGNYIVSLIVFNDCGADQHFDTVYLLPPMMCNFTFTVDENGMVHFEDESIEAESYHWDFGDGTSSSEQHPDHQYGSNGTYECCLTIETGDGQYTYCAEVKVETLPEEEPALKIYVNTSGQSLVIDIPADGSYRINIYDTWGKPAYSGEAQLPKGGVFEVGLTNLPPGVYIVTIESAGLSEQTKVVVPQF